MRTLALSRSFDGVLAWDSFFHLSPNNQRAMFAVFSKHSIAGAALMFTSGPSHGKAVRIFRGEPLYHASLSEPEYRALLSEHGYRVARHVAEDPDCGGHTVWLAQLEV